MNQPDPKEVAKRLRELADHIDSDTYPKIYHFSEEKDFMTEIKLVLSYPWPG